MFKCIQIFSCYLIIILIIIIIIIMMLMMMMMIMMMMMMMMIIIIIIKYSHHNKSLPASAPRQVLQRPWYMLSCLWNWVYKIKKTFC